MKQVLFFFSLIFLLTTCGKDDQKDVIFDMPYRVEFEIPAGLNTVEDHFFQFNNNPSLLDSLLGFYGYERADISSISPKSLRLNALFGDTEFRFVQEVSLWMLNDSGRRSEAFWRPEVPLNIGGILEVPGTLIDAHDFFLAPEFDLELQLDTREVTSTFASVRMELIFAVRGK